MKYILFLWGVAAGLYVILMLGIPRSALPESLRLIRSALPTIDAGTALLIMTVALGFAGMIHAVQHVRRVLTEIRDGASSSVRGFRG